MKNGCLIVIALIIAASCEKETELVSFRIRTEGFVLQDAPSETNIDHPPFTHRVTGGTVRFTAGDLRYDFDTWKSSIESYMYELPPGEYRIEFFIEPASLYGQKWGSFTGDPQEVVITEQTDTINVKVKPHSALFLVSDESGKLEDGVSMIQRYEDSKGIYNYFPLSLDTITGLYYAYFTPDPYPENPSAYLWFYGNDRYNAEGGLSTVDCKPGSIYRINIIE